MFTGEKGGLWRQRGHPLQALVGVGFAAHWEPTGINYQRLSDSYDEAVEFVFDGVDEEQFGGKGLITGGAVGQEVDRYDPSLESPSDAYLLATSEDHTEYQRQVIEEFNDTIDHVNGWMNPEVQARRAVRNRGRRGRVGWRGGTRGDRRGGDDRHRRSAPPRPRDGLPRVRLAVPTVALRLALELYGGITHLSASGTVDGEPARMPVSTEDQHLLEGVTGQFTSPEALDLAARGGIDIMFVGGAQIDRRGRMNGSAVGDYDRPKVRFGGAGAGGSGSLLPLVDNAYAWRTEHSPWVLPEAIDFVTASGNLNYLVTPLCEFERRDGELRAVSLLPGATREDVAERTRWDVSFADPTRVNPPTEE